MNPYPGSYPGQGGFPTQQPGYPAYGQPSGATPYPMSSSGGLPYPYAPPSGSSNIGFGQPAPAFGGAGPGASMPNPGGYPGQPDYNTPYPAQPGFPSSTQPGYPAPQPGYPASQPGYPAPQPGYPAPQPGYPASQPGYPAPQPGYPAQSGYPAPPQPSYPGSGPAQPGYPAQSQPGYPAQSQPGYPAQSQPGYPAQSQPGYQTQSQPGYPSAPGNPGPTGYGGATAAAAHTSYPGYAPLGQGPPVAAMGNMSISSMKPNWEGTVKPYSPFNAEQDAGILRKAMKGIGTDEKAIISVLCNRSNQQRLEIKKTFKTAYGKDLIKELKSELSGRFEDLIIGLLLAPAEYDATCIRNALSGGGTDEGCLIEILSTRTNSQITEIKTVYKTLFKRDMEKDLMSDTSGHFKRLLVSLANAGRRENAPVDMAAARQAATELYQAGAKKLGTDESKFNQILCMNSHAQLQAIFSEYKNISSKTIESAIKSEMSGDLEQGMLAIVKVSQNLQGYFADRLNKSMKGAGTKDSTLIRVMVTRCEIDMVQIKQQFQAQFGKSLESWIEDDTSGDYKHALQALAGRR